MNGGGTFRIRVFEGQTELFSTDWVPAGRRDKVVRLFIEMAGKRGMHMTLEEAGEPVEGRVVGVPSLG